MWIFAHLLDFHTSFVNVLVTGYSADTVLAELARCLALFPNLHTVQLNFRLAGVKHRVDNPFKIYRYPSIKNAYVCPVSDMILKACPEARIVSLWKWNDSSWWPHSMFDCATRYCPALEVLGPFVFGREDMKSGAYFLFQFILRLTLLFFYSHCKKIAQSAWNISASFLVSIWTICFCTCFHEAFNGTKILLQKVISSLSELRYLRIINIIIRPYRYVPYGQLINDVTWQEVTEWVQWAKDILSQGIQNSEDDQEPRKVIVYYETRKPAIHLVNIHHKRQ